MKTSNKFATLLAIATANPAGFTVDAATLEPVAHGYACAVADTQNSFGTAGLARVIDFVNAHPGTVSAFGGWLDDKTGLFYWDATAIFADRSEALAFARRNGQLAIFDLDNCEEIRIED